MTGLALARLLQMTSQALPIGGYSHSQGLESAIDARLVVDEAGVLGWTSDLLEFSLLTFEIPLLGAMHATWVELLGTGPVGAAANRAQTVAALRDLNEEFLATREAAELRAATVQMGYSLRALLAVLPDIPVAVHTELAALAEPGLPCAWSAAAAAWGIDVSACATGYLWSWAENQVLVAIKTLPLGQSAGQRIALELGTRISRALAAGVPSYAAARSNFTPSLAILSAQHETQYSRLFRS